MKESQEKQIEKWLRAGNTLTFLEAVSLCGCGHLASRISHMRLHLGIDIKDRPEKTPTGKWIKRYYMELNAA